MLTPYNSGSSRAYAGNNNCSRRPTKRPRIEESKNKSFSRLSTDVNKHIVGFLSFDDQIPLFFCSKKCREIFDQFQKSTFVLTISNKGLQADIPNWWGQLKVLSIDFADEKRPTVINEEKLIPLIERNKDSLVRFEFHSDEKQSDRCISEDSLAAFGNCSKLTSVDFRVFNNATAENVRTFFCVGKPLRKVVCSKDFTDAHLKLLSQNCAELEQVFFNNAKNISSTALIELAKSAPNLCLIEDIALKKLSDEAIAAVGAKLKRVSIPKRFSDRRLNILSQHCPKLEAVTFEGSNKITTQGMINFAKEAKNLRRVEFDELDELSSKAMQAFQQCPIQHMRINLCGFEDDEGLLSPLSYVPQTLVTFDFSSPVSMRTNAFDHFPMVKNLRHMKIVQPLHFSRESLVKICNSAPNLQYFALDSEMHETDVIDAISSLKFLEYLELIVPELSDKFLDSIPRLLPNLRILILNCYKARFTKNGLMRLNVASPQLEYLSLNSLDSKNLKFRDGFFASKENMREIFPNIKGLRMKRDDPGFPEIVSKYKFQPLNLTCDL